MDCTTLAPEVDSELGSDELQIENFSAESAMSFHDGQEVQLDDGSTAYIFHQAKDSYPSELVQPIQLENGSTAYLYHTKESLDSASDETKADDVCEELEMQLTDVSWTVSSGSSESKAFKCDFGNCSKVYTTAHHLKVHKRVHTGEKPYRCTWKNCNKDFMTSYSLKSHHRVHTGEKPYPCPHTSCSKAFKTAGDLQKHIRTHTGEKPFKCPFEGCNKAFTTSNICKVHIRTHTGERPYTCPYDGCKKNFSNITNYRNHTRIHTGEKPYVCVVGNCGKQFTEYSSLYKHQIVHSMAKPYSCQYCGKLYRQTSTLVIHKRKVHKDFSGITDDDFVQMPVKNTVKESSVKHFSAPRTSCPQTTDRTHAKKLPSVLVVPVENMQTSSVLINPSPQNQLPVSIKSNRPTDSSSDEPLLVTLGDNLTITSTTPGKLAQQYLKDFSSSKKDEGELFINEDPDTASLPHVVEGSDSEASSFNSNIWVNYSNGNQALNKQVESDQYSVATLVIDGTNYLVQVVNEHDQSTCPPDQETVVTALSAPGFQSEDLATSSLSVSKERDIGIHLGENLILHAEQPETLSAGDIIALELSAPASSCSEIVSDLSHLLCTPKQTKTPISTSQNNLVTPSIPSYTITSNQLNTNDAPNIQTDSGNTKILNNQVIKSKAIRSSTPKKITVKLPISSLNRQRNKLQI